jgi:ferrochelatase
MRNWAPYITDALAEARAQGVTELVAIPLAPQYSRLSIGKYKEAVGKASHIRFVDSWHDQPHLLDAFAEKVKVALAGGKPDEIVFTAHSLPTKVIQEGDPYAEQVAATARGVASRVGLAEYQSAYQSAGRTPEPWLSPTLEECLEGIALAGKKSVLVVPVGFVSDHTEILFDIDIKAARFAQEHGLQFARTGSLNTDPRLIEALRELVG